MKIGTIGAPTCNRVEGLRRCLKSYMENAAAYGRSVKFVVVDDSSRIENRQDCRQMLSALRKILGLEVCYGGVEEKLRYAKRMIETGEVPSDVVKFALFDVDQTGAVTIGANRNALLLDTVGEAVVSVDDDTLCRIASAPKSSEEVPAEEPTQIWFFPDHRAALRAVSFEDCDFLALHERYLGEAPTPNIHPTEARHSLEEIGRENNARESRPSRTAATINGLIGDCGWSSPLALLLLRGASLRRLLASDEGYRSACTSREILRCPPSATRSRKGDVVTTGFGFDNTQVLPPFLPVGRGEDTVFGATLSECVQDGGVVHLPQALLHEPVESRVFWPGEITRSASGVKVSILISLAVGFCAAQEQTAARSGNCEALGSRLEAFGALPSPDFLRLMHQEVRRQAESAIASLEDRLREFGNGPRDWSRDVRRFIEILSGVLPLPEVVTPLDLLEGRTIEQAQGLAQRLVRRYGRLLRYWPTMLSLGEKLREQGRGLTRAV